jgi:hypothetical protein
MDMKGEIDVKMELCAPRMLQQAPIGAKGRCVGIRGTHAYSVLAFNLKDL